MGWRDDIQPNVTLQSDTQHNYIQYYAIQHCDIKQDKMQQNDTQHCDIQQNKIQPNDTKHNDTPHKDRIWLC